MNKRIITVITFLVLVITNFTVSASGTYPRKVGTPVNKSQAYKNVQAFKSLFNIKNGARQVCQWRPGPGVEDMYPQVDFSNYMSVLDARIEEDIEHVFDLHKFSINENGRRFFNDSSREREFPNKISFSNIAGKYNIEWKNNLPVKFTLDEESLRKDQERGAKLEDYDLGFEWITVTYDTRGLPVSMTAKLLPGYGHDFFSEVYSDYVFNQDGNWVKRKVLQRYGIGSDNNVTKWVSNEYRLYM